LAETTTLTLATAKKTSLRTTVPMSIVKQFNLKQGDKLEWAFEVKDGNLIVIVKPIKIG
jgi:bifunctional DNA-binding transcriptional regulator/antitoxin component of YhaV-PrlF toxin-antitoxin module